MYFKQNQKCQPHPLIDFWWVDQQSMTSATALRQYPEKQLYRIFCICIQNPHPAAAEHWNHPVEGRVPPCSFL